MRSYIDITLHVIIDLIISANDVRYSQIFIYQYIHMKTKVVKKLN